MIRDSIDKLYIANCNGFVVFPDFLRIATFYMLVSQPRRIKASILEELEELRLKLNFIAVIYFVQIE